MTPYIPLCFLMSHEPLIGDVEGLCLPIIQAFFSHDHLDRASRLLDEVPRLKVGQSEVAREIRGGLA